MPEPLQIKDFWRVNSYGYPNPFNPDAKSQEAWATFHSFYDSDQGSYSSLRLIPLHPVTQYEGATQLSVGERVVGRESALCLGLSRVAPLRA